MSVELSMPAGVLIGVPLLLAAAGLLLNAYLVVRRPRVDPTDLALEAVATESMEELLLELQRSLEEVKGQLARQRASVAGLLSESPGYPAPAPALEPQAPAGAPGTAPEVEARAAAPSGADLRAAVDQLLAEGLSDRAVARRLRIGLEEVRLARQRAGRAS